MKKATLKQIADMAGVSVTTVHRALNGKSGCSKELERKIRRLAEEYGYSANLAASSLRKPPLQIAFIFPFRDNGGRYGLDQILDGYLEYRREMEDYNIVFQEYLLRSSDKKFEDYLEMDYPELERVLRQIYMEQPVRFDGVIVYGLSVNRKAEALLNRIMGKGTKVVVMERLLPFTEDTCTVKSDTELAGNLAGEMLCSSIRGAGTVAVIGQLIPGGDPAADRCTAYIQEERPDLKLARTGFVMNVDIGQQIADYLKQFPDLTGIYATCGRHTKSMLDALKMMDTQGLTVVGSDLFTESHEALHNRTMTVLLDKRPAKVGYMALHLLISALVKKEPLPQEYRIPPRIILRSNSDTHFVKREYQHESDQYSD